MNKDLVYRVVSSSSLEFLADGVNEYYEKGYVPIGGIAVVFDGHTLIYYQAIEKKDK